MAHMAYDGDSIWADLSASNVLQTRYLRGDQTDQIIARMVGANAKTVSLYLTDRLGSVRNLTDVNGNLIDTITYDGFGNVTNETNAMVADRWKYTGRELDAETGLQFNRARYLDQKAGRWTSQDPLRFDGGDFNLYRYVRNSPNNATDPWGLQAAELEGSPTLVTSNGDIPAFAKGVKFGAALRGQADLNVLGPYNDPKKDGDAQYSFWVIVQGKCLGDLQIERRKISTVSLAGGKFVKNLPEDSGGYKPANAFTGTSDPDGPSAVRPQAANFSRTSFPLGLLTQNGRISKPKTSSLVGTLFENSLS
ncbi:MAG TPA: RHS repeat-associated core domain-containing protein [Gemmataceae bacterium]|jgi:RHS repeat-associated protein|nr:RHS repeat-associated core domain-containing protein [Gemmataceae bacterium]